MSDRPTIEQVTSTLLVLRKCRTSYGADDLDSVMDLLYLWERESDSGKRRVAEETLRIQRENEERIERIPE